MKFRRNSRCARRRPASRSFAFRRATANRKGQREKIVENSGRHPMKILAVECPGGFSVVEIEFERNYNNCTSHAVFSENDCSSGSSTLSRASKMKRYGRFDPGAQASARPRGIRCTVLRLPRRPGRKLCPPLDGSAPIAAPRLGSARGSSRDRLHSTSLRGRGFLSLESQAGLTASTF